MTDNAAEVDRVLESFSRTWCLALDARAIDEALASVSGVSRSDLSRNSEALAARTLLGLSLGDDGVISRDLADAITVSRRAELERSPDRRLGLKAQATVSLAMVLADRGRADYRRAEHRVDAILERIENLTLEDFRAVEAALPWVWLVSGEIYLAVGRVRDSVQLFRRVITRSSGFPAFAAHAQATLAMALEGRSLEALNSFDYCVAADRDVRWFHGRYATVALAGKAIALGGGSRSEEQHEVLARLQAESPNASWAFIGTLIEIRALRKRGQLDAAERGLRVALEQIDAALLPPVTVSRHAIVRAELELVGGLPGRVIAVLDESLETADHLQCIASLHAFAYLGLGMPEEAIDATERCKALGGGHSLGSLAAVYVARAAAHLLAGRPHSAMISLSSALDISPALSYDATFLLPRDVATRLLAEAARLGLAVPDWFLAPGERRPTALDDTYARIGALSAREREVLLHLRDDVTMEEIAGRMFVARNTIKSHGYRVNTKLGVTSRGDAVAYAVKVGFYDAFSREIFAHDSVG